MFKFSNSHRNQKRIAAIWILEKICASPKMLVTAIIDNGQRTEINQKRYEWHKLRDLIFGSPYDKQLLRDACDLLHMRDYIDILDNDTDRFDIKIKAFKLGETALTEDIFRDEIENYNSDKRFRNLRWQLPLLMLLLTSLNIGYTFYKDGKSRAELNELEKSMDNLKRQLEDKKQIIPQQTIEKTVEILDSSHTTKNK